MTEQLYTLADAKRELALQDCQQYGHSWDAVTIRTMADPAGTPVGVQCTRCGEFHAVQAVASAAPEPPAE
jgi:hypothetical protein